MKCQKFITFPYQFFDKMNTLEHSQLLQVVVNYIKKGTDKEFPRKFINNILQDKADFDCFRQGNLQKFLFNVKSNISLTHDCEQKVFYFANYTYFLDKCIIICEEERKNRGKAQILIEIFKQSYYANTMRAFTNPEIITSRTYPTNRCKMSDSFSGSKQYTITSSGMLCLESNDDYVGVHFGKSASFS